MSTSLDRGNALFGKTALVLIEFQNEFACEGGKLNPAVKDCMAHTNMIQNSMRVVEEARKKGLLVVHCPITFSDAFNELSASPYGVLAGIKENGCFKASDWGSHFIDSIQPKDNEVIVSGKRGLCGFYSTNLDFILRQVLLYVAFTNDTQAVAYQFQ